MPCTKIAFCGDHKVDPQLGETCDDDDATPTSGDGCSAQCTREPNNQFYGGTVNAKLCAPGCVYAPFCGDGVVSHAEQCDKGAANNTGGYGKCKPDCTLDARCGDGIKNGNEQCDHGAANNGSGADSCKADCTLKCGDGLLQPGEECDNGLANNTGGYGKCKSDCTLDIRCGDGFKNGSEECDDGKNDGSYGTCKANCKLADYCGDNITKNPPEICDMGPANSASAYGLNLCTNRCSPAPYCGDRAVDTQHGETCDDGINSGQPGFCATDCKSFIPSTFCGNGTVNPPEECDDGTGVNGTTNSRCDARCRFKCGNGFVDPGETCDNGVNDGSYGACTTNCQIAGYCGDNIKNGPEQCDNGAGNVPVANAYGPGVCTTACTFAPSCGDGRVDSANGEQCDGTPNCTADCKKRSTGPN